MPSTSSNHRLGSKRSSRRAYISCEFIPKELKPGEDTYFAQCGYFEALRAGHVKIKVGVIGCPDSTPSGEILCGCPTEEYCEAVKEFELEILPVATKTITVTSYTTVVSTVHGTVTSTVYASAPTVWTTMYTTTWITSQTISTIITTVTITKTFTLTTSVLGSAEFTLSLLPTGLIVLAMIGAVFRRSLISSDRGREEEREHG